MDKPTPPPAPRNLSIRLPEDVAALLHRVAYETGRSKHDLVIDAIRRTYGER
jgi:predicted transcriptional regulator